MSNDILIYDIESATDGRPDPKKDKLKLFGCYSYKTKKYYFLTNVDDIQKIIDAHKYLVGFNIINYDNVILERYGIKFKRDFEEQKNIIDYEWKIFVDLYSIIDKRAGIMKVKKGMLGDLLMQKSLKFICEVLDLVDESSTKLEFDYKLLNKDVWTKEEIQLIKDYTQRDLELTKKLYEFVEEYFGSFKHYLNEKDVKNKIYLTASPASFCYKVICKELGWTEEYNRSEDMEVTSYGGGYVSYPAGDTFSGSGYIMDFTSAYPHAFFQCNLYSPATQGWHGNDVLKVNGTYNDKVQGPIEKLLIDFFNTRKKYKDTKDPREYTIKIIINTIYGLSGNPVFKRLYDKTTASDCTSLVRQWIFIARRKFKAAGFNVVYSDTDSCFVFDVNNLGKDKLLEVKADIIKTIKDSVPFPADTFNMGIENEITNIWFFKGNEKVSNDEYMDEDDFVNKGKGLMKKNYIYITKEGKVVVKNLGMKKKSTSKLSREIFWKYMIPEIIKNKECKFSKTWIRNLIQELLKKDIGFAALRYDVRKFEEYIKSSGSIHAQISKVYGEGIHFMIPNIKNVGVGKGKSYCTIDEFNQRGLKIDDIDLTNVWDELNYFIKPQITKNIFEFG